jgi:hydrogenase maturation factor
LKNKQSTASPAAKIIAKLKENAKRGTSTSTGQLHDPTQGGLKNAKK